MRHRVPGSRRFASLFVVGVSVLVLLTSACSKKTNESGGTPTPSASSTSIEETKDATIAAELPAEIAAKGTLTIAADATYAPNEFFPAGSSTMAGMDVDLGNALAQVLGLQAKFSNLTFDAIIIGLGGGRYDVSLSSITDKKEREKKADFVTYASVGTSFYTAATGGPDITGLDSLCGLKVGVESATTQKDDATAQKAKCTAAGKQTVEVNIYPGQTDANLALSSGRVQVVMADTPVAGYAVKQSGGKFRLAGTPYGTAPYGIAVPRQAGVAAGQAPMSKPVLDALKKLMADGVYQRILAKWGLQEIAITTPVINGAIY